MKKRRPIVFGTNNSKEHTAEGGGFRTRFPVQPLGLPPHFPLSCGLFIFPLSTYNLFVRPGRPRIWCASPGICRPGPRSPLAYLSEHRTDWTVNWVRPASGNRFPDSRSEFRKGDGGDSRVPNYQITGEPPPTREDPGVSRPPGSRVRGF